MVIGGMLKLTMRFSIPFALAWLCFPALSLAQAQRPALLDPADKPLAIQDEEAILVFLQTAQEVAWEPIGEGITKAQKLTLVSKDGVKSQAAFHDIHRNDQKIKRLPNDNVVGYVRDSYTSQVAAYRLGRLLKMPNIPPTVLRRSKGVNGSVQFWIENAMTEKRRQEKGIKPGDRTLWNQLYADMRVFDNLINNIDRNTGNMLVDSTGYLWLIDHTRSFGRDKSLPRPETISLCSNQLYEAIRDLDEATVETLLSDLLAKGEIKAIFRRRVKLLEKIDARIEERGRTQVMFDYGDPDLGVQIVDDGDIE